MIAGQCIGRLRVTPMSDVLTPALFLEFLTARGPAPALLAVRGEAVETWSCADLALASQQLAWGLVRSGLQPGEPVALYGPNRPSWVAARLAIGAAGGLPVPLDDLVPETDVVALIRDSGCRRIFVSQAHHAALAAACAGIDLVFILLEDEPGAGCRSWRDYQTDQPAALPHLAPDAPASLVYTSGTTGSPKSFVLSHANISANVRTIAAESMLAESDRVLLPLPLDNVYPFVVGLMTPLMNRAAVVFPEAISGPEVAQALRLSKATAIVGVPRLYASLVAGIRGRVAARGATAQRLFEWILALSIALQRHLGLRAGRTLFASLHRQMGPELRMLVSGGARFEADLIRTLEGLGWDVRGGYGLAEVGSVFTANLRGHKKIGSEGRPIHPGSVRIADPRDADGIGEIQLKGPSVFSGYRNNPEATAAAFTPDGWFKTGDLGRLDQAGLVYVTGRLKEMLVLGGGKNVFPEELERIYGTAPCIQDVAVLEQRGALVGLVQPDHAVIGAAGNRRADDVVRVALAEIGQGLPSYQRLSGFALVDQDLPKTRLGKYRRFLLPEIYEAARSGRRRNTAVGEPNAADRALLDHPLSRKLWSLLGERCPDQPLSLDADLQLDLGIDSLEWMTLALELERDFGVAFTEDRIANLQTARDLLQAVADSGARSDDAARADQPSARADHNWMAPQGASARLLHRVLHGSNRLLLNLLFRFEVSGAERLPKSGPCLLVANHASDLDPAALAGALPPKLLNQVYWGADAVRVFGSPLGRRLAHVLQIFPVDERAPAQSLEQAAAVLATGKVLVWFPESWRSPDGTLQQFLPGVGRLVEGFDGPIHPVAISGAFEAWPRSRRLPRPGRVKVRIGPAVDRRLWAENTGKSDQFATIAETLRAAVAELQDPG